jgi:hypothetical protein
MGKEAGTLAVSSPKRASEEGVERERSFAASRLDVHEPSQDSLLFVGLLLPPPMARGLY